MTIDSQYQVEEYLINGPQEYPFTFEHIGSQSISIQEETDGGFRTNVSSLDYDVVLNDSGPIYEGGQINFNRAHGTGVAKIRVIRSTPKTQLVDYQAYGSFPAETHEFALDKLTLIIQEGLVGTDDDGSGGGGDFVARSGDSMTGNLNMIEAGIAVTSEIAPLEAAMSADGVLLSSRRILALDYQNDWTFGGSVFATRGLTPTSSRGGVFFSTATTLPNLLTGSGEVTRYNQGDLIFDTYEVDNDPASENRMLFTYQGFLKLPRDPVSPEDAATKQYVDQVASGGPGSGDILADNEFIASQSVATGSLADDNNRWSYGSFGNFDPGDGLGNYNGGVIQPVGASVDNLRARMRLSTRNWDGATATQHNFYFHEDGSFTARNNISLEATSDTSETENAGALVFRAFDPNSVDNVYFSQRATVIGTVSDDGLLKLTSSGKSNFDQDDADIEWYRGSYQIEMYDGGVTSSPNPDLVRKWRFESNGDFTNPGKVIIRSDGDINDAQLVLGNIGQESGAWALYSQKEAGSTNLYMFPSDENGVFYRGGITLFTKSADGASLLNVNQFIFLETGELQLPDDLYMGGLDAEQNGGVIHIRDSSTAGWSSIQRANNSLVLGPYDPNDEIKACNMVVLTAPSDGADPQRFEFNETNPVIHFGDGERATVGYADAVYLGAGAWEGADVPIVFESYTVGSGGVRSQMRMLPTGELQLPNDLYMGGTDVGENGGVIHLRDTSSAGWSSIQRSGDTLTLSQFDTTGATRAGDIALLTCPSDGAAQETFRFTADGDLEVPNNIDFGGDLVVGSNTFTFTTDGRLDIPGVIQLNDYTSGSNEFAITHTGNVLSITPQNAAGTYFDGEISLQTRNGDLAELRLSASSDGDPILDFKRDGTTSYGTISSTNILTVRQIAILGDDAVTLGANGSLGVLTVSDTSVSSSQQVKLNAGDPVALADAARKAYVDSVASDMRLKHDIVGIEDGLDIISSLNPVTFQYNDDAPRHREWQNQRFGFIAQEVQNVLPGAVHILAGDYDDNGGSISGDYLLGMDPTDVVPHLVNAVQQLLARVEELEND